MRSNRLIAASLLAASLATPTLAQVVVPGQAQPGRERESLPETMPQGGITQDIITPGTLLTAPSNAQDIKFVLKSVDIEGNTVIGDAKLEHLYKGMIGQEITLLQVYELAESISLYYRKKGYLISQAVVPAQEIEGGHIRIRVVEGFVDQIEFRNQDGVKLDQRQLNHAAKRIKASKPLKKSVLERQMLLLNDLSGVEARAVVVPSPDVLGAANLIIEVKRKRVGGEIQVDNRGSRYVGPWQWQGSAYVNGVVTDYDQLQLLYATSGDFEELHLGEIRHTIPLALNGLKAMWRVEKSNTAPGYTLQPFDVKGDNLTVEGQLSYPLIRGRKMNLETFGGLAWQDLETKSLGTKISKEKITTARVGLAFDAVDKLNGRNNLSAVVARGLDILGASDKNDPLLSRVGAEPQFTKVNAEVSREQFFGYSPFSLLASINGQYSPDSLVASQEFGVGGSRYGRAYDSSEITGDSGVSGKLEARYTRSPDHDMVSKVVKLYQPYVFYDGGVAMDNKSTKGRKPLTSAGTGLRFSLAEQITLEVEASKPLTRTVATEGDKDWRGFVSLSKAF